MAACNDGRRVVPFEEVNVGVVEQDTMIYGFCASGSAMNTLQIITDADDTITLNLIGARERNMVLGGYAVGDEMAVAVNSDTTEATLVINKSALNGNWVMPNPLDGSADVGISIQKGGTAESIDQGNIVYKSWRLFNGKLLITAVNDDGIGDEETLVFTILRLTPDSLVISQKTAASATEAEEVEVFEMGRQNNVVEQYRGLDVENDEDFVL